jgi:hypothetical protein
MGSMPPGIWPSPDDLATGGDIPAGDLVHHRARRQHVRRQHGPDAVGPDAPSPPGWVLTGSYPSADGHLVNTERFLWIRAVL